PNPIKVDGVQTAAGWRAEVRAEGLVIATTEPKPSEQEARAGLLPFARALNWDMGIPIISTDWLRKKKPAGNLLRFETWIEMPRRCSRLGNLSFSFGRNAEVRSAGVGHQGECHAEAWWGGDDLGGSGPLRLDRDFAWHNLGCRRVAHRAPLLPGPWLGARRN